MNDLEKNHKRQIDRLSINKYPVVTDAESYKKAKKAKKSYWISYYSFQKRRNENA